MSLLFRYLTKNNAMILLPTLAVGIGLYVLTDLFERLDNFIEAGLSVGMVLTYFVVKMPLVISQILPVIFLLSTVIQLCIMARSRELTALQAGGISLGVVANSMILCGIFWGGVVSPNIWALPGNASPPASGRKRSARRTSRQRC